MPIVVLGLLASSSPSLSTSTSMTPLRQEIDHSKSPSSSSTSTSTTSSKEIDNSDHPPSESVDRQVRGDPCSSEQSEELLHDPTKIPKPNNNENHEHCGSIHFCSNTALLDGVRFGGVFLLQRRFSMPRRGWQALDTPSEWYEVIRGPRPRSVQWPLAKVVQFRQPQVTPGRQRWWDWGGSSRATRGPQQKSPVPRLDPDEMCAAAQTKVQRAAR